MPFEFKRLEIPEVILVGHNSFQDDRGYFAETYKQSEFQENGIAEAFVQDNFSHSMRGVLRGLHYQMQPGAQGKLLTVVRGEIYDVVVDIRKGSPTYGQWIGLSLSYSDRTLVYVPAGFAHGFCVTSGEADVAYKVTAEYAPGLDRGIAWNDPNLAIQWPIEHPILSPRDANLPNMKDAEINFVFKERSA